MAAEPALWCVVPAAGSGQRFGADLPKQYVDIAGQTLLQRTLQRLATHPHIAGLMVVLAAADPHWAGLGIAGVLAGKPVVTTVGGGERADSVLAGLLALPLEIAPDAFVLVHDAARPCVRTEDISRLIEQAAPLGGGLLAVRLADTLKRADNQDRVLATEPRESRWRALTPQMFRRGELVAALEAARADGVLVTDEAMAMERLGHRPLLVAGAADNIKITSASDQALATFLLTQIA